METTINHHHNHQKDNQKLSKVLSTKLSIEDYNAFLILTKIEYKAGLIKEESPSELLRFTIRHILNQAHSQPEYLILKQQEQQQIAQNNQQRPKIHSQIILPSTTSTSTASNQHQVPNISRRNNYVSQNITRWKSSR